MSIFWRRQTNYVMPINEQLADLSGALCGLQTIVSAILEDTQEHDKQRVLNRLKKLLGEGFSIEPTWLAEEHRAPFKNSMSQMIFSMLQVQDQSQLPPSS
jgi:hypothetical protein